MCDFSYTDGGTVRMKGIIQALADKGHDITFISNAKDKNEFPKNMKHIFINKNITNNERRKIQLLIAILPFIFVEMLLKRFITHFAKIFAENLLSKKEIIFFEYFDNSLAYVFQNSGLINSYVNDIHGIGILEFWYSKQATMIGMLFKYPRYFAVKLLDYKVYKSAAGLILINDSVKNYLLSKYSFIRKKRIYYVADGISKSLLMQEIDNSLIGSFRKKYHIDDKTKIVLFVGAFKDLGGVSDLVKAFIKIHDKYPKLKLLLIGDGQDYAYVKKIIQNNGIENKIILLGRTTYNKLKSYQKLSDIIVCPDKNSPYPHMIIHTKYLEALYSGKVVINGNFTVTREINNNEQLSLSFEPSNVCDLASKLIYAIDNLEVLSNKYKGNAVLISELYGYNSFVNGLL
jgi:glycosyltransferase involved in cell wall biosynthesis